MWCASNLLCSNLFYSFEIVGQKVTKLIPNSLKGHDLYFEKLQLHSFEAVTISYLIFNSYLILIPQCLGLCSLHRWYSNNVSWMLYSWSNFRNITVSVTLIYSNCMKLLKEIRKKLLVTKRWRWNIQEKRQKSPYT